MTARRELPADDAGLTLVELLVSVFVGAIVLSLVSTILVTTLQATASTRDRDLATGRAQAISTSLTTSMRNADAEAITVTDGGTVLRAAVTAGSSAWSCRAWVVVDLQTTDAAGTRSGADGRFEVRTRSYPTLGATETAPTPTTAWSVLTEHVVPATTDAGSAKPYFAFTPLDRRLTWAFAVAIGEQPQLNAQSTAPIAGSAVALGQQEGAPPRC